MNPETASAIEILQDIEARSLARTTDIDDQEGFATLWAGLAFKVAGIRVLAPMDEVSEILILPGRLTRVPGAKVWVKGIANIRGNLLPIVDLQAFLGGKPIVTNRRSRVLVINRDDVTTGLLVGDVQGMRHFSEEQSIASARIEGAIGSFVKAAYKNDDGIWPVLSMDSLVNDERFRMAAA
jgi:twitching motility protein PilI